MIRLTKQLKAIFAVLALSMVALPTAPALATSDLLKTQAPGFFRTRVGDFEVTTLYDGGGPGAYQVEMFKGNPKDVPRCCRRALPTRSRSWDRCPASS